MKKAPTSSFYIPFATSVVLKITLPGVVIFRDSYTRTEHICNQAALQISSVLRCISSTDEIKDFECHLCCHRKVSAPLRCSSQSSRLQPLFRASGHKRYNTLDFAALHSELFSVGQSPRCLACKHADTLARCLRKVVCQVERCSPMEPHANRLLLAPIG